MIQLQFLKVTDDRVIGLTGNIVEIFKEEDGYCITPVNSDHFTLEDEEKQYGDDLWAWATHPDRCIVTKPDPERSRYQDYKRKGGFMDFDRWVVKFKQHQQLIADLDALDEPQDDLLRASSDLENLLLL